MRSLQQFTLCLLLSLFALPGQGQPAVTSEVPDPVTTTYGPVQGVAAREPNVTMWLGIPYAAAPVGEQRWRAPQAPAPWTEPLLASTFGSPCMQIGSLYGPPPEGKPWGMAILETFGKPIGAEDCLTLNIWRPDDATGDLPVLVFVHGGSGVIGHSSESIYEGSRLAARAKAIVVTINYRLNIFGAFSHPALAGDDAVSNSGNFATLDTLQALRFIQDNAQRFGGDPGNVTLMGQSAGGFMVYRVMGSKVADGLFQKALVLSAGISKSNTLEEGAVFVEALTAHLMVSDGLAPDPKAAATLIAEKDPQWLREYLHEKSAAELIDTWRANREALPALPGNFGDGVVMPVDLPAAYEAGEFIQVPTLIGTTRDEAKLLIGHVLKVDLPQRFTMMVQPQPEGAEPLQVHDLIQPWFLSSWTNVPYNAYMWVMNKLLFRLADVDGSIAKVAAHVPQVYAYRFDWDRAPEPWHTVYGAGHSMDLPFIFGNFENNIFSKSFIEQNQAGREALSALMMETFGAFLHNGDPNVPGLPSPWMPFDVGEGSDSKFIFDATDDEVCAPGGC
ncbi:carboxylesterase/lipase family protein [Polycyclovorans algicola]|uniref:carboxylesterase/lipase family protein n=1 Tax=Polycyclovorans algicola TaxID=616992 RepID=UPI000693577E|nr:carboxylesterase family protein [Polycyclovorans algicola]